MSPHERDTTPGVELPAAVSLAGRTLLAIFAHPDDESLACGGLLALCAERGARVVLLCATHGENNDGVRDEYWFELRARELEQAAAVLGVAEVILLDFRDGFLVWSPELGSRIADEIRRVGPDAVITFGRDGLYWHQDHVALCTVTTAVVAGMGASAPALYYVTMPPGVMRRLVDEMGSGADDREPMSYLFGCTPDAFGLSAEPPSLVVDVSAMASRKLAALQCHRSQVDGGVLARITPAEAARYFGVEHFHRPPGSREAFLDAL